MLLVLVDNLLLENGQAKNLDLQPHLGLISLVAVARQAGHDALLYDPKLELSRGDLRLGESLYQDIARRLLIEDPDVVGLTSLGCNFICTLKIARYLKARKPRLPILLGGPHATILDREILSQFPVFDLIVRNEAELTLLPVLEQIFGGDLTGIPGITYRSTAGITANPGTPLIADLDSLPFPAFDSYPIEGLHLPDIRIEAGRGCPFQCSFCSTATFFGRRYRLKSPERIGAEMDHLHARYGLTHFKLTHDLFTVDRRKVAAFCQFIRGKGYTWGCSARMDCVDEELLAEMTASGCRSIYYGIETGSRRMQKLVEKHLDLELVEPTLAATHRLGMTATASFITGFPEEEQADQDETLDLAGRCFSQQPNGLTVQLHLLTPEPGTKLSQRLGTSLEYDGHITDFNFPTFEKDDASIMRSHPAVFLNHHFYPTVVPRPRHVFVTSVYLSLQSFGYAPVTHLTEFHGGRLSRLLEDMYQWAVRTQRPAPYDEDFVCSYVEHNFRRPYLESLFRYLRAAQTLAGRDSDAVGPARRAAGRPGKRSSSGVRLVMSPRAGVFRRIHNVPKILQTLDAGSSGGTARLPSSLQKQRLDLLLFVREGSFDIQNFELPRPSADLLDFLGTPRSLRELRTFARLLGGNASSAVSFVRELRDLDILVGLSEVADGTTDETKSRRLAFRQRTRADAMALVGELETVSNS